MNYLQAIVNFVEALHWPTILALLASSAVVSVVAQLIKKFTRLEQEGVIKFMVASLATLSTALQLIIANPSTLNMLGIYAAATFALTQAIYPIVRYAQGWIDNLNSDLKAQNNQPPDKVLTTDGSGEAVYAAPSATDTGNETSGTIPEAQF